MHRNVPKNTTFASIEEINTDIGQQALYYRSKLAQILVVRELCRRLAATSEKRPVLINATHPGDFNRTPLTAQLRVSFGFLGWLMLFFLSPFMPDPIITGCRSALFACTSNKELLEKRIYGKYIVPDKKVEEPSAMARDELMGKRLWEVSMDILREKLGGLEYGLDI